MDVDSPAPGRSAAALSETEIALQCLVLIAQYHQRPLSLAQLRSRYPEESEPAARRRLLSRAAAGAGMAAREIAVSAARLARLRCRC